ncbi:hypothetical protein [Novosphingobium ginsenosidimutans]|uniref:Uncharacterized protein n=1 Tax=Novosphingobium ginsenosidimutans TaxID=1176536 RepID=A0A5B8S662_9SPHN|nr:hypothetical protein [Novosphingobium ginsenosidimutans]QEA17096.1 hypothetical protein FRF71_13675 [Novosphingobium ginsenosidimutans]
MTSVENKATKDAFHTERSRFLDAFAALEEALGRSATLSKTDALAKEITALRAIRNDLVHSQLRFVQLEGQLQALAVNAQNVDASARPARILRIADFKLLSCEIEQVRKKVSGAA